MILKMKKHVSEWHRVGVSINSIGKSKQNLCSASPEITNLLRKEIKAYKRYFASVQSI